MDELRCAIELREDEERASPGRLYGVLLRYNERAGDRPEVFEDGALTWPDGPDGGIVINEQHNRQAPIMRVIPEDRDGAVVIDAQLPDTTRGRDAAVMIRNGTLRGLSIEFRAMKERNAGGVRSIAAARLTAAGLVDDPSYGGSRVEVRADDATAALAALRRRNRWR